VANGLQLASIETDDEFTFVRGQLSARGLQNEKVWIGGTDVGWEDNYYWLNARTLVELDHWDITEAVNPTHK